MLEARRAARYVFKREEIANVQLRIVFVDDVRMTDLNGKFMNHWRTTDVLTFPLERDSAGTIEAEIYVNSQQAKRQAAGAGVTIRNEIARLIIHGVLHLLGYDDRTARLRKTMSAREEEYLKILRVA